MITFENTSVMNIKNAVMGARNPMNSWDRSDSVELPDGTFQFGPNDLDLAVTTANSCARSSCPSISRHLCTGGRNMTPIR